MKKKEKCAVIFKTPVSYCRFVSALESPVFARCGHTRGGVPGRGSVRGEEAWGILQSFLSSSGGWGSCAVPMPDTVLGSGVYGEPSLCPYGTHGPAWEVSS